MPDSVEDRSADDEGPAELSSLPGADRSGTFYVASIGLLALLVAYFLTIRLVEAALDREFQHRVDEAILVSDFDRPIAQQIRERVSRAVSESRWVRWGGVRVTTLVLAQDGVTWLYVDGHGTPVSQEGLAPNDILGEWMSYLPATAEVTVTLPHSALLSNGILIGYALLLLPFVWAANRRQAGKHSQLMHEALAIRDAAARRTKQIEEELARTRSKLSEVEPIGREQSEAIDALQRERESLHRKLAELAAREESLRGRAAQAAELVQEVRALEDLLEEATEDLESKDGEIGRLERSLKKAARSSDRASNTRGKATGLLARRFRTLYKTIEIDDRAIADIASLGDESLRLKAEEAIKRLAEEADNVAIRRKVGGLPGHVHVFEIGFAGKGRIYYTRGRSRRFRILLIGAKNTQPSDLDYLARLPRHESG